MVSKTAATTPNIAQRCSYAHTKFAQQITIEHLADFDSAYFSESESVKLAYITDIARFTRLETRLTRAVLRLECSLDYISGSVGYQQNIFIFSLSAFLFKLKKCNYKKCNWVSGSPSILYKLVLSPVPIVHTNFQENLLMSYSWCPQLSR